MKTTVLNYNVIVKKEKDEKGKIYYETYVPALGFADAGDTIDEAMKYTQAGIKLYIETLVDLKEDVPPPDCEPSFMTVTQVKFDKPLGNFAFA